MYLKNDKEYFIYFRTYELHYSLLSSMALQIFKNSDLRFEIRKHLFDKRPFDVVLRKRTTKNEIFEFLFTIKNYKKLGYLETHFLNQFLACKIMDLIHRSEDSYYEDSNGEVDEDLEEAYLAIIKCNRWDPNEYSVCIKEFNDIPFQTQFTRREIVTYTPEYVFYREEICTFWIGAYNFFTLKLENTEKLPFLSNTVPFYHSLTSKKKQKAFIKTIKKSEIDAYNYCHGSISFEKAVREFYN